MFLLVAGQISANTDGTLILPRERMHNDTMFTAFGSFGKGQSEHKTSQNKKI